MERRIFLKSAGAGVFAAGILGSNAFGSSGSVAGKNKKPDVLVILVDQWTPQTLGVAGDPDVKTPNLDMLATKDGILFDACYTSCPVCVPARAGLISGLYPHNTRLWRNANEFYLTPADAPMFLDMKDAGYTTAQIGKLHWNTGSLFQREFSNIDEYRKALGLDYALPLPTPYSSADDKGPYGEHLKNIGKTDEYRTDMKDRLKNDQYLVRQSVVESKDYNDVFVADKAVEYLRSLNNDNPYCLVVSFPSPHVPLDTPGEYAAMYKPEKMHLYDNVEAFQYDGKEYTLERLKEMRAMYLGKITLLDDCVGKLIKELKDRGTYDNTLILFTADHGELMGSHGFLGKGRFWEESARVPLIAHWPGKVKNPGRRIKAPVQMFDIYATIVDAAGGTVSSGFSKSFLPVVRGDAEKSRDAAFTEYSKGVTFDYMVRTEQFKYWTEGRKKEHLFDIKNDPYEMNDLAGSPAHQEMLADMRARLNEFVLNTHLDYAVNYKPRQDQFRESLEKDSGK